MTIEIKELYDFFQQYKVRDMPTKLLNMMHKGTRFECGVLETTIVRLHSLQDYSPEIAEKIKTGYDIEVPCVREFSSPFYYVYDPHSGKNLGSFDIR